MEKQIASEREAGRTVDPNLEEKLRLLKIDQQKAREFIRNRGPYVAGQEPTPSLAPYTRERYERTGQNLELEEVTGSFEEIHLYVVGWSGFVAPYAYVFAGRDTDSGKTRVMIKGFMQPDSSEYTVKFYENDTITDLVFTGLSNNEQHVDFRYNGDESGYIDLVDYTVHF